MDQFYCWNELNKVINVEILVLHNRIVPSAQIMMFALEFWFWSNIFFELVLTKTLNSSLQAGKNVKKKYNL